VCRNYRRILFPTAKKKPLLIRPQNPLLADVDPDASENGKRQRRRTERGRLARVFV
jgi:hypothetical protein